MDSIASRYHGVGGWDCPGLCLPARRGQASTPSFQPRLLTTLTSTNLLSALFSPAKWDCFFLLLLTRVVLHSAPPPSQDVSISLPLFLLPTPYVPMSTLPLSQPNYFAILNTDTPVSTFPLTVLPPPHSTLCIRQSSPIFSCCIIFYTSVAFCSSYVSPLFSHS